MKILNALFWTVHLVSFSSISENYMFAHALICRTFAEVQEITPSCVWNVSLLSSRHISDTELTGRGSSSYSSLQVNNWQVHWEGHSFLPDAFEFTIRTHSLMTLVGK
jgi:hypothetical protein